MDSNKEKPESQKNRSKWTEYSPLKVIRSGLGKFANREAKETMLGQHQRNENEGLNKPEQTRLGDGGNRLRNDKFILEADGDAIKSSGEVNGWVMAPSEPGKPTVVFYGGSDFDRAAEGYQDGIGNMAKEAQDKGMGFAVYDYPEDLNEASVKEYTKAIQSHLVDNGVPLKQQAYAGYSQGSFPALHSADTNDECAGVHVISGFSSARLVQKQAINEIAGPISKLIEKRQLTENWDNMVLAKSIADTQKGLRDEEKMPVSTVHHKEEAFGSEDHMLALNKALEDGCSIETKRVREKKECTLPDKKGNAETFRYSDDDYHMTMLQDNEAKNSFSSFIAKTDEFSQNRAQREKVNQGEDHGSPVNQQERRQSIREVLKLQGEAEEGIGIENSKGLQKGEVKEEKKEAKESNDKAEGVRTNREAANIGSHRSRAASSGQKMG